MNDVTKLTKHFTIGELDFSISINRAMAVSAFKQYPQYYDAVLKNEQIIELLYEEKEKNKTNKEIIENVSNDIKINDTKTLISYMELQETMQTYSAKIVKFLLPEMLAYNACKLPNGVENYDIYANYILEYCEENDILEDYYGENCETQEVEVETGLYSNIMEFITLGFMQGNTKKKGKLKIITN